MPMLALGLAAAGVTVAATSYLVPLIITVGSSVVLTISSFFVGKKYEQYKKRLESQEIVALRKEQYERDNQTRDDLEKTLADTQCDVKVVLNQSKTHQSLFGRILQRFTKSVDNTEESTKNLHDTSLYVQGVANNTTITVESCSSEIDSLKTEIQLVNQALKISQTELSEKSSNFDETLEKLNTVETQRIIDAQEYKDTIEKLQLELDAVYDNLAQKSAAMELTDTELQELKTQNARLGAMLHDFEETVTYVSNRLNGSVTENQISLQVVQALSEDNKHLVRLIDALGKKMAEQEPKSAAKYQRMENVFRMFK